MTDHIVTRANLEQAIDGLYPHYLSDSVRIVLAILWAIQRGDRIVIEEPPQ